ncbi:hypothetical protein BDF14DRAFT_1884243 [Spinellus fusiger]|nr:hypothetical protein BDF14DRAFT_1884243 [Spinellus fusiger]
MYNATHPKSSSFSSLSPQKTANVTCDPLSTILQSVRQQIDEWGEHAKWKIDLILLDDECHTANTAIPHPPQSPLAIHQRPRVGEKTSLEGQSQQENVTLQPWRSSHLPSPKTLSSPLLREATETVPVTSTVHYPWNPTVPMEKTPCPFNCSNEELYYKLDQSLERQKHLDSIVRSQGAQLEKSASDTPDTTSALETMRSIYLMSENEQRLRYMTERRMSQRELEVLSAKLKRMSNTLHHIESIELPSSSSECHPKVLQEECIIMRRKLHLLQLRLSARDAELEYLHETLRSYQPQLQQESFMSFLKVRSPATTTTTTTTTTTNNNNNLANATASSTGTAPTHSSSSTASSTGTATLINATSPSLSSPLRYQHKGPPYLFQQQYSPKIRSEIRPHPISALDSLGIVADQMLNDLDSQKTEKNPMDTVLSRFNHDSLSKSPLSRSSALKEEREKKRYDREKDSLSQDHKRSKRSIDLANTLLSIPNLVFPSSHKDGFKMSVAAP